MINWRGLGGALTVTVLGLALTWAYVWKMEQTMQAATETQKALVFSKDLPAHHILREDDLSIREIPKGFMLKGTVTSKDAIGRELVVSVFTGEQVIEAKLMFPGEASLRNRLPPGYRAIAVAVNNGTQLSGELKAGDYVDIILVDSTWGESQGRTLLENVQVIGVKVPEEAESWQTGDLNLILSVKPPEAEKLAVAGDAGKLYVALRNQNEKPPVPIVTRRVPKPSLDSAGWMMVFRGLDGETVKP